MICPKCEGSLVVLELDSIEIDYCFECGGLWLDEGELELLLGSSSKKTDFLNSFSVETDCREQKIKCPICAKKMNKVVVDGVEKTTIDQCVTNCGIWFDEGELLQIIKQGGGEKKIINLLEGMFEHKIKKNLEG